MKITLKYTESTTRNTDSSRTTNRNLDLDFDMEDASVVESTRAILDILTNREFLNAVQEYRNGNSARNNTNVVRTVDWDWEGAFREAIRDIGTPWAIEHLNKPEDVANDLVAELAHCAPGWVVADRVDAGVNSFVRRHDIDLSNKKVDKIVAEIERLAISTGFAK